MKTCTLLILFVLYAGLAGNAQPCANQANIYSFTYNGTSYEVVKELKTWTNAAACAVERGGYLVEIGDQAEQDAVYDAIINGAGVSPTYTVVPDGGGVAYVWIGATDKQTEGTWLWDGNDDGTGINFWNGEGAAGNGGGSSVGGAFVNWGGASSGTYMEPDDFGGGQDAAAIALAGWPAGSGSLGIASEWNDISISNAIYFVIEIDNTGLFEKEHDPVRIFPVPARDRLTISSNQAGNTIESIALFTSQGVPAGITLVTGSQQVMMQVSSLPSGLYLMRITMQNGEQVLRRVEVLR